MALVFHVNNKPLKTIGCDETTIEITINPPLQIMYADRDAEVLNYVALLTRRATEVLFITKKGQYDENGTRERQPEWPKTSTPKLNIICKTTNKGNS